MVIAYYQLNISSQDVAKINALDEILGVSASEVAGEGWLYELREGSEEYVDFINMFLDILEDKYESLSEIGISRSDIYILAMYSYNGQMNTEFSPDRLERLGRNGIRLAISCWEDSRLDERTNGTIAREDG